MTLLLRYTKLHPNAITPTYATPGSAAMDIHAINREPIHISEGKPGIIPTGLAFAIPDGWVLEIHSRSGHGFRNRVRLGNCQGVIDPDYRGELKIQLTADPGGELVVNYGDRIAQALLVWAPKLQTLEVDAAELGNTSRGDGGFGSTGA